MNNKNSVNTTRIFLPSEVLRCLASFLGILFIVFKVFMSAPTGRKRVRRSAHSFAATPFGIICQRDTCRCPLVGRLAVVPTARTLRSHVAVHICADSRQDFAAIRRELVADTQQEIARAYSNPTALRATLTPSSRGWFCSWCFYTSKKTEMFGGTSRPPNATRFSQTRGLSPSIVARFLLLPTLTEEFRTRTSSASSRLPPHRHPPL